MNQLDKLREKFSSEIKWYGITSVRVQDGNLYIDSDEPIPYELRYSIEVELLY